MHGQRHHHARKSDSCYGCSTLGIADLGRVLDHAWTTGTMIVVTLIPNLSMFFIRFCVPQFPDNSLERIGKSYAETGLERDY